MRYATIISLLLSGAALLSGCVDVVKLETELSSARCELVGLRSRHAKATADLADLQRRHTGQTSSHETLGLAIRQRDEQIATLKTLVADRDRTILQLRDAKSRLEAKLTGTEAEREALRKIVAEDQLRLETSKANIARLTAALRAVSPGPPPLPPPPR